MAMIDQQAHHQLASRLALWEKHRRLVEGAIWVPRGILTGLMVSAVVALLARLWPLFSNREVGYLAALLGFTGAVIGLLVVLIRRRTVAEKARFADRRFGLAERISAAVEISTGFLVTSKTLAREQLADTLQAMDRVNVGEYLPVRPDRREIVLLLMTGSLLVAAIIIPNPLAEQLMQERLLDAALEDQEEALEDLIEAVENNPALSQDQQEEIVAPLEGALEELQGDPLSLEESVAVLSEAEAELRELVERDDQDALLQTLDDVGGSLSENTNAQTLGETLQSGDLSAARSSAAQLADRLPELSASEREQLAGDLREAVAGLQTIDPELAAELEQAARMLDSGEIESASEALQEAASTLQERAQTQAANQQAAAAADQLAEGRQELAQAGALDQAVAGSQSQDGAGDASGDTLSQGQGSGEGEASEQGQDFGGPGPGGGHAEEVYVPGMADLGDEHGVDVELPAACIANPDECGALLSEAPTEFGEEQSLVPYNQVFGDYRNAAFQALEEEYIPLGLKGYVRDYFSYLEP
jgi:hypothetical protein